MHFLRDIQTHAVLLIQAELCLHVSQKVQYMFLLYSLEASIHYYNYYYYYFEMFRLGLLRPSPLSRSVSRCSQINNTLRELRTQQTNILTLHDNLHILYTMYIIQHPSIYSIKPIQYSTCHLSKLFLQINMFIGATNH